MDTNRNNQHHQAVTTITLTPGSTLTLTPNVVTSLHDATITGAGTLVLQVPAGWNLDHPLDPTVHVHNDVHIVVQVEPIGANAQNIAHE